MDRIGRRRFLSIVGGTGLAGVVAGTGVDLGTDRGDAKRSESTDNAAFTHRPLGQMRIVWSVETTKPLIALTFDDGPHPELTPRVLRSLDARGIRATFNVMGICVLKHPDMVRSIVAGGHEIGNHTWTHRDLSQSSAVETLRQLRKGKDAIEQVSGMQTLFFRPPRGELTGIAARYAAQLGYDVLMWSVSRGVNGIGRPAAVAKHIGSRLSAGAIVGMHDGLGRESLTPKAAQAVYLRRRREVELEALPRILDEGAAKGFAFVTVSELLAAENTR
jgi:peptidoglycan/xylan/chitin deacetylase (PgdA/CDA1 family)